MSIQLAVRLSREDDERSDPRSPRGGSSSTSSNTSAGPAQKSLPDGAVADNCLQHALAVHLWPGTPILL